MILYIIKSILCSAVFIIAYHLFLENEKINKFKRFYLLASLILSLAIPAISVEIVTESRVIQNILPKTIQAETATASTNLQVEAEESYVQFFMIGYALITLFFLLRFTKNLLALFKSLKANALTYFEGAKLIVSSSQVTPHTFWNYIFVSEHDSRNQQILTHELTHSRQWHSLDILFIELLHCIFWFNPVFILYKKAVKLNHEFLADDSVLEEYQNVTGYQQLLIDKITGSTHSVLASSFNYSITKKRFTMMTTVKNKQRSVIRIASALIVFLAASFLFINKVSGQAPQVGEYTIYMDGKWQNVVPTNKPGPDNLQAFMKGLQRALSYPKSARADGIEGDVAVMFEVNEKGQLRNFKVVKKLQADCEAEVINAIKNSGTTWNPAEVNGRIYPTRFVFPTTFRFDDFQINKKFDLASIQAKALNEVIITAYAPTSDK